MSVCDIVCSNPFFLSHTTQGLNVFIWQCWREKHKYFEGGIYTWPSFCFVFCNSPAPHWSWSRLLVLNSRVKLLNYLPFRLRWFALNTPVQIWLFSSVSLYVYVKTEKRPSESVLRRHCRWALLSKHWKWIAVLRQSNPRFLRQFEHMFVWKGCLSCCTLKQKKKRKKRRFNKTKLFIFKPRYVS